MMQQQLLDMTDIPTQIQAKLAMVTKALEQFIMDPEALANDDEKVEDEEEEECKERESSVRRKKNKKQFPTIDGDEVVGTIQDEEEEYDEGEPPNEENFEIEHSTRETSYSFEDLVYEAEEEEEDDAELVMAEECEESDDDGDESLMTEEKLKRIEERKKKNEKIQTLEKSWQKLCENQKTIHK